MILVINNTINQKNAMYFPMLIKHLRSMKGFRYKVVNTQKDLEKIDVDQVTHIIISGSPLMVTKDSIVPNLDQFILNILSILRFNVPILGICFGCQLLNILFGGKLKRLRKMFCEDTPLYRKDLPATDVRFCLTYVIDEIPPSFEVLGRANIRNHQVPCMIKHKDRPIYGCLFHPEFHDGIVDIITNFINDKKI